MANLITASFNGLNNGDLLQNVAFSPAFIKHPQSSTDFVVVSTAVSPVAATAFALYYLSGSNGNPDQQVTVTRHPTIVPRIMRAYVRLDPTEHTGYCAAWDSSAQTVTLYKVVSGALTQLGSVSSGVAWSLQSLSIKVDGDQISVWRDGVSGTLLCGGVVTDASISAGYPAFAAFETSTGDGGVMGFSADTLASEVATTATLSGPTSGATGAASAAFTISTDAPVSGDVTFSLATSGSGAFSVASPVITAESTSVTFTYTPSVDEVASISFTNDGGLSVSHSITYTSTTADVTAPILSAANGAATGPSTAAGGVTTDDGTGTLYAYCSTSATPPSATDLKAGTGAVYFTSQAISSAGVKSVTATGLAESTTYYFYFLHSDASGNDSAIVSSSSFTTQAPSSGSILTDPFMNIETGTLMVGATIPVVLVIARTDNSVSVLLDQTTNGSGNLSITGLVAGDVYAITALGVVQPTAGDTGGSIRHYEAA